MQALSKVEHPKSPKPSLDEVMKKIIHEMEKGKASLGMIIKTISLRRSRFKVEDCNDGDVDDQDVYKALDHHLTVALTSYVTSISMLQNFDHKQEFIKKRKIHHLDENDCVDDDGECKYNGSSMHVRKDHHLSGRGRYKRSESGEAIEKEVSHLCDDGFAWRKYGQKTILNAKHPRNYYRCTHKHDQKCLATKQVQQISENPTKYMIIYHGKHTCYNNILKPNQITIDPPQEQSSTILLSFDQSTQLNPMLFPTPIFLEEKQEHKAVNEETMPSVSRESSCVHNQYSSRFSDAVSISRDLTGLSSTPVSEQSDVISTAENYSEDYSHVWEELEMFQDLHDPY